MLISVRKVDSIAQKSDIVFFCNEEKQLDILALSPKEKDYVVSKFKDTEVCTVILDKLSCQTIIVFVNRDKYQKQGHESIRIEGSKIAASCNKRKVKSICIVESDNNKSLLTAFLQGILLGNYQFIKYFTNKDKKKNTLEEIQIASNSLSTQDIEKEISVLEAVYYCRNFVNEPVCYLNAEKLALEFQQIGDSVGIKTEILNQAKIEALKMGGLLSVNKGSIDPASFTIMEWKPENKINEKPIILVGKGVVFDSGGMNLKPDDYMNDMKGDMAGAATMAGTLYAIAKNKLPVHVIALIPATDNRPGGNAFVSGDIITMHDGTTVEVLNTDAEGRMILADALSYAKQYEPELVIDSATLTGAAERAIGKYGIVAMQNKAENYMDTLKEAGKEVYERLAEFPFWEEYDELIKSDIADIKNVGGTCAGMITAGKFLARFTNYPYIHLDIAGVAFADKTENYYSVGGTGYGIRLLYHFIEKKVATK